MPSGWSRIRHGDGSLVRFICWAFNSIIFMLLMLSRFKLINFEKLRVHFTIGVEELLGILQCFKAIVQVKFILRS